jgi:hypothetical protein
MRTAGFAFTVPFRNVARTGRVTFTVAPAAELQAALVAQPSSAIGRVTTSSPVQTTEIAKVSS